MSTIPSRSSRNRRPPRLGWLTAASLAIALAACGGTEPVEEGLATPPRQDDEATGAGVPTVAEDGGAPAGSPPGPAASARWLTPSTDCPGQETTIYVTGLLLDMATGEAECERNVVVCADALVSERRYDSRTESCPWASGRGAAITSSQPGPRVCCQAWDEAKRTHTPCDPLEDADCDGLSNEEDPEPLSPREGG